MPIKLGKALLLQNSSNVLPDITAPKISRSKINYIDIYVSFTFFKNTKHLLQIAIIKAYNSEDYEHDDADGI